MLREEFQNPSTYSKILKAVAKGYNTLSKISNATGIPKTHLTSYLETLEGIGFIEYRRPLWPKRGYYTVKDYLLRFYYSIMDDVRELIELEQVDIAFIYGHSIRGHSIRADTTLKTKNILGEFNSIGKIIHRGVEVDLALVNSKKKRVTLIEVKWNKVTDQEASRIIQDMRAKASKIRKLEDYTKSYIVVVREADVEEYKKDVVDPVILGLKPRATQPL